MTFFLQIPQYYLLDYVRDRFYPPEEPPTVSCLLMLLKYGPWVIAPLGVVLLVHKFLSVQIRINEQLDTAEEGTWLMRWCMCWANRIIRVKKQRESNASLRSMAPNVGSDTTIVGVNDGLWHPSVGKRHKYAPNPLQSRRSCLDPSPSLMEMQ